MFQKIIFVFLIFFSMTLAKAKSFTECPESPNCVSSLSTKESHKIEPLKFLGSVDDFKNFLNFLVEKMPRVKIVSQEGSYAHLEFTSLIFRFKDDVEMEFLADQSLIHVRSASRVGYSDLGANRNRVKEIENLLIEFK